MKRFANDYLTVTIVIDVAKEVEAIEKVWYRKAKQSFSQNFARKEGHY